ncbi:MAG: beta-ketoacyl-[acyl-carrier-protein] synthase II [Tenericutes bacterium GWC2_34_14]|nr:MAG: beta-ketoacyl-[acyl-carrier-protein] synthase II [Tenericutes bacterium GWC2_34_14]OHE33090.1 MAG: beta-ketoacyl-[acyl-carrier-protein] synthase II [Tenericutes bacterium GWE2_34_108]OHE36210.1 MAG: beta-ketoacyl-[acyl-carrier-protein] synthase II [Tenericutes bacterium GWF1_35_14]OHE38747.1 MAG: beta-ketoacyl-[acyl-carrier-protein] synthase II [Tenericutes bacterium GWF2_35_184]OHE44752.1 MAG: beta-ketoacyl-[acyl-carrier-protein] synthase II [Tenericutes bacterium RIFOXYA2_FULL_36_32]
MKRRVVVTGMGLVSPVGNTVEESFKHLVEGKNGIDFITLFDASQDKVKIAGEVKNLNFEDFLDKKEIRRADRVTNLALVACIEAINQSKFMENTYDPYRVGTFVGSGIGGLNTIYEEVKTSVERGQDRISPFFIPNAIINLIGAKIGIKYQAKGPNLPQVTACSAATNSIGEAFRYIRDGYLDAVITGGAESPINPIGVGGFSSLKALNFSNDPEIASVPFDSRRTGFVIAEGAGILILESYEHAIKRGAPILAEMVGYGTTSDAFHMTAPDDEASGITACLKLALDDAKIKPEQLGYINAHGTSTVLNDKLETLGFKKAFGDAAYGINISSTKSMTGHALGAAGAIETIAVIKALETGLIPPTIHLNQPDPECDLNYTPNHFVKRDMEYAMNVNIGFGGQNAAIIFKKVNS